MNKRIFAMLMALAMIISMVPVTALAAEHSCDYDGWIITGEGKHKQACSVCEKPMSPFSVNCEDKDPKDGACDQCGQTLGHKHSYTIEQGNDGYHKKVCSCNDEITIPCTFVDGVCNECGATQLEPECGHGYQSIKNNEDGTHTITCRDCDDYSVTEDHVFENGLCRCGAIYVEAECEHGFQNILNNNDGTHTITCRDCDDYSVTEDHVFENGLCRCGAIYVENHECTEDKLVSISETQHQFQCECGEFVGVAMNHYDADGDNNCDGCGYTMFEVEHECTMDELVSISETQHQFQCECGEFVGVAMNHYDADGDNNCDGCGYTMYEVEECEHEWKGVIYRDETTHTVICRDCQEELVIETHTYQDNMPCVCGAINLETECEHEWKGVSYKNEATHNIVCRDCGEVLGVESHMYLNNMPCACGAIYSEPECEHEWKGVTYKDEATHTIVCRDCLEVLGVESHMYLNNMPCACGAIYSEPEHEHDWYESEIDEADCKHKGSIVWKCTGCDEEYTETLDVNPDNHVKMVRVRNIKAKCERGGYEVWFCFGCHEREVIKTEATGHNYQVSKENHKYIKYSCEDCGDYYIEKKAPEANERPSHGHHHWFSRFPFSKYFR